MGTYIIRRLLLIIPTLFLASLIVFFMIRLIPGDVIDQMVGGQGSMTGLDKEALRHALGLDLPIHVQYWHWITNIFVHGSLGTSLMQKTPVTTLIQARLPVTLEIGLMALVIAILVAIPIGIYSATRQDSAGDYVGRTVSILFMSVPNFWIGTIIMVFPALWWGWSPPVEWVPLVENPLRNLGMCIIPACVEGIALSGVTMRMTRTMMLEVLRQDYIRTAWSKGLVERTVITRHVLKNALIPVVTMVGLQSGIVIGGAVIIEQIFALPGVGRLMLDAINTRDYPVVSGVMLMFAIFLLFINLIVDLSYSFMDPRVRYN